MKKHHGKKLSKKSLKHLRHEQNETPEFERKEDMRESDLREGLVKQINKMKRARAENFGRFIKAAQDPNKLAKMKVGQPRDPRMSKKAVEMVTSEANIIGLVNLMESGEINMLLRKITRRNKKK